MAVEHDPDTQYLVLGTENSSPVRAQAERGKVASRAAALLSSEAKNTALGAMAAALRDETASILAANADKVAQYKAGKDALFGFFVGQAMKAMAGKANPQLVNQVLREKLG